MLRNLRLLTVNHHTTGVSRLQEVGLRPEAVSSLRAALSDLGIESVVLATCNRSEVYWRARQSGDDEQVTTMLGQVLSDGEGLSQPVEGAHAARHLFRVCAGLESLIIGEAEILGQVRSAASAVTCDSGILARVFTAALRAGGVARSGTDIGRGAMSVASVTVNAVAGVFSLRDASVLIVGAGQTATKVARHVRRLGVGRMMVTNRTQAHADTLARTLDADVVPLEALPTALCAADVVIVAASHPGYLITTSISRGPRASVVAVAWPWRTCRFRRLSSLATSPAWREST